MSLGRTLLEWAQTRGVATTVRLFQEARKKGTIQPHQISLRDLAESLCGHDWHRRLQEWRGLAMMAALQGVSLQESGAGADSIGPSTFSNITGQLLVDRIWEKYKSPEFIGSRLVRTIPCGPNLGTHKVPGIGQVIDAPSQIAPGQQFPFTSFKERWKVLAAPAKYGEICAVTFEMIYGDLTGQAAESADSVGWRIGYWEEEQKLNVVLGLVNNYKEAAAGDTVEASYNTYQTAGARWTNAQTGQTLINLRPLQSLRVLMRRNTDPDTGKRIRWTGNYPLLAMPGRELDAERIVSAVQLRMGAVPTSGNGDQVLSTNVLKGISEVLTSPIAEKLMTDSGVTQSNCDEYFYHGDFQQAFYWREVHPLQVVNAPPMNPLEFNQDIVLAVRGKIFGVAGVWEPRHVGTSKNS